jgi:type II secretory pathway pseudopilin PulG
MQTRPKRLAGVLRWRGSFRSTAIRCGGFLLAELIISIALLGLIMVCLAVSMNGFSLVNDCQWARQRCTAAAQAQLDSLSATGGPIEPKELQRLWPGVAVSTDRSSAAAPWEGLELIQTTATTQAGPREIMVRLTRYVRRASPLATQAHATGGSVKAESLGDGSPAAAKGGRS